MRILQKVLSHPILDIIGVIAVTILFVGVFLFRESTTKPPIDGMENIGDNTFSFSKNTPKTEITISDTSFSRSSYTVTLEKQQDNAVVVIKNITNSSIRLSLVATPLAQTLEDPPVIIPSNSSAPYIIRNEGVYTIINSDNPDIRLDITVIKEK